MLTNNPFNIDRLKEVINKLAKAEKIIKKKEEKKKEELSGKSRSTLDPQRKREKFVKDVVVTSLFKSLQLEFFKIIPKLGQEMLTVCSDAYNNKQLTNEQRDQLAKIGNVFASELPFKMLSGSIDVKQGFGAFMGALRMTHEFLDVNPSVALSIGPNILSLFKPLENFIKTTKAVVKKSDVPESIKEGFSERLDLMQTQSNQINKVVKSAEAHPVPQPKIDPSTLNIDSLVMQELQKGLLTAIFPVGGTILNVGLALHNANVLNEKQRNELGGIGMEMMGLPFQLLTGKKDLNGVISGLTNGLKSLGNFLIENPEVAVKVGATILPAMLPLGGFLTEALSIIGKSELAQSVIGGVLKTGLGLLSNQLGNVEGILEKSASHVLKPKGSKLDID